jgi:hypothetical protein
MLVRAIGSYGENHRRWGRAPTYLIIDSSPDPSARRSRVQTSRLASQYGVALHHFGPSERRRYARALARRAGIPSALASFALLGHASLPVNTGAARNNILVHTVGRLALLIDDDTLCDVTASPGREEAVAHGCAPEDIEYYFSSEDLAAVRSEPRDYLAVHETLLGRTVPPPVDSRKEAQGYVAATMTGTRGDSGHYTSIGYLLLTGGSRDRLLQDRRGYTQAFRSRRILRAIRRPTIARGLSCIAINLGLDGLRLLPPFLPVCRNSDGVFAAALAATLGDAHWGLLPWVIDHEPVPRRIEPLTQMWKASTGLRLGDLVIALIRRWARGASPAPPDVRLHGLGAFLIDSMSGTRSRAADVLEATATETIQQRLNVIDRRLESERHVPDFWAKDMTRYRRQLKSLLASDIRGLAMDVAAAVGTERARRVTCELIRSYGHLLQVWLRIRLAAEDLSLR